MTLPTQPKALNLVITGGTKHFLVVAQFAVETSYIQNRKATLKHKKIQT